MIIFVDVDGVCADLGTAWLARYNRDYNDHLTINDLTDWGMTKFVKPECGNKIDEYLNDPSLYDEVESIPGSLIMVDRLRDMHHRVIFATSCPWQSAGRKFKWLCDHGFEPGYKDYIEVNDKSLLLGDALIDDGFHNIESFNGLGILYDQPWNRHNNWPVRACRYSDVIDLFKSECVPIGTHPTELNRPHQCKAFYELMDKMYQVHLDKNQDYSPANILGTGEIGLCTRTWDKTSRLMNLHGFRIEIENMRFDKPQDPKNESIDDNIQDLAVYAIIWQLYRKGVWGK
jgi:5'-nucleotidase